MVFQISANMTLRNRPFCSVKRLVWIAKRGCFAMQNGLFWTKMLKTLKINELQTCLYREL